MPVESIIRKILGDTTELDEKLNDIQEQEDVVEEEVQEEQTVKKNSKKAVGEDSHEDEEEEEEEEDEDQEEGNSKKKKVVERKKKVVEDDEEEDDEEIDEAKGETKEIKAGSSDVAGLDDDEDDLGGEDTNDTDDKTGRNASKAAGSIKNSSVPQEKPIKAGTKVKMEHSIIDLLGKLSRKELAEKFNDINSILSKNIEDIDERKSINSTVDFSEDINALLSGEKQDFSEDFTEKALTIFETAVNSKVKDHVENLEERYQTDLQEAIIDVRDELAEQLDMYLDYVVSEWMNDNELAVEQGLKHEVTESFIAGMKDLFESHQIDVPDEKVDLVEQLQTEKDETKEELDNQLKANVELRAEVAEYKKAQIIEQVSEDLTDSQKEKMATLCEGVDFDDEDTFTKKAQIIAENYFSDGKDNGEAVDATDVEIEEGNERVLTEHTDIAKAASMIAKPSMRA